MCLLGPEFDQPLCPALLTVHVEAYSGVGELLEVGGQQKSDWVWGMAWNKGRLRLGVVRWGGAPLCHRIHVSPHSNIITHCLLLLSSPLNQWAVSSSSWFQGLWSSILPVNCHCKHFKVLVGHKKYIPQKYDHRDLANKMLDFIFQGMHFIQPSKAVSPLSRSD